jgi:hypothetical protein
VTSKADRKAQFEAGVRAVGGHWHDVTVNQLLEVMTRQGVDVSNHQCRYYLKIAKGKGAAEPSGADSEDDTQTLASLLPSGKTPKIERRLHLRLCVVVIPSDSPIPIHAQVQRPPAEGAPRAARASRRRRRRLLRSNLRGVSATR